MNHDLKTKYFLSICFRELLSIVFVLFSSVSELDFFHIFFFHFRFDLGFSKKEERLYSIVLLKSAHLYKLGHYDKTFM